VALVRRRATLNPLVLATVTFGGAIVSARLVGLAYLDLTAFQALSPSYLAPAHAVATAVVVTALLAQRKPATRSSLSEIG
jgi:hypothetical protein